MAKTLTLTGGPCARALEHHPEISSAKKNEGYNMAYRLHISLLCHLIREFVNLEKQYSGGWGLASQSKVVEDYGRNDGRKLIGNQLPRTWSSANLLDEPYARSLG
jgi:hypothetical protein